MTVNNAAHALRAPAWALSHGSPLSLYEPNHPAHQHWKNKVAKDVRRSAPKGIVIVSAHWQAEPGNVFLDGGRPCVHVNTNESNPLIFDFYGFPEHFYKAQFPTSNPRSLNQKVISQLKLNGFQVETADRGLDHGVWVPLKAAFGDRLAIPLVQVSLPVHRGALTDGIDSLRLGKALRGLRDEGLAIVGSGQAVHNLRDFFKNGPKAQYGETFPPALTKAMTEVDPSEQSDKDGDPARWQLAKQLFARDDYLKAHPTPEHLLPMLVALGAAHDDEPGVLDFELRQGSLVWDMFRFGDIPS